MNGVRVRFLKRDEILRRLKFLVEQLAAERPDVLEVSLFGSLVRGNYGPGSDADIFILLKEDSRRITDRMGDFLAHFSAAEIPVEVFPYTEEEVAQMEDRGFMKSIRKEKLVLFERGNH